MGDGARLHRRRLLVDRHRRDDSEPRRHRQIVLGRCRRFDHGAQGVRRPLADHRRTGTPRARGHGRRMPTLEEDRRELRGARPAVSPRARGASSGARAQAHLRELQPGVAARLRRSADLQLRMHVLRRRASRRCSTTCARIAAAASFRGRSDRRPTGKATTSSVRIPRARGSSTARSIARRMRRSSPS